MRDDGGGCQKLWQKVPGRTLVVIGRISCGDNRTNWLTKRGMRRIGARRVAPDQIQIQIQIQMQVEIGGETICEFTDQDMTWR